MCNVPHIWGTIGPKPIILIVSLHGHFVLLQSSVWHFAHGSHFPFGMGLVGYFAQTYEDTAKYPSYQHLVKSVLLLQPNEGTLQSSDHEFVQRSKDWTSQTKPLGLMRQFKSGLLPEATEEMLMLIISQSMCCTPVLN